MLTDEQLIELKSMVGNRISVAASNLRDASPGTIDETYWRIKLSECEMLLNTLTKLRGPVKVGTPVADYTVTGASACSAHSAEC